LDDGAGNVTFNDATWNVSKSLVVGLEGSGTLSVTNGGMVSAEVVQTGVRSGSSGDIALTNGGTLNASISLSIGSGPQAEDGSGTGTITVDATSLIKVGSKMIIQPNQSLALSGGSLEMGPQAVDLLIVAGGTLSGYGTVSAMSGAGISDFGTISATGGTLILNGAVHENGVLSIGAASTAYVDGPALGHIAVEFSGAGATLELATGIMSDATLHDFAVGDHIVMAGVNGIGFDAALDVLELKENGHAVDRLQLVGSYAADQFTISQSSAGAVIGLTAGH
jgi:T5SS/PEP-CTERM-associated repeat protein